MSPEMKKEMDKLVQDFKRMTPEQQKSYWEKAIEYVLKNTILSENEKNISQKDDKEAEKLLWRILEIYLKAQADNVINKKPNDELQT